MANNGLPGHVACMSAYPPTADIRWPMSVIVPITSAYRVAGGSYPPPAPTERSVRISRTTLFGEGFTAQRMPGTAGMAGPGVVAVAASSPL